MSAINTFRFPFDFKKVYYLAGPMSGIADFNYPAFEKAEYELEISGIKILSPHKLYSDSVPGTLKYEDYLKTGFRALLTCDGIILLKGWGRSKGARRELDIALDLKYPVYYYDNWMLTTMNLDDEASIQTLL